MAIDVSSTIVVRRPRPEVAAFVCDPANDRAWIRALTDVRVLDGGALGVGTRVERTARLLGRPMRYTTRLTALDPGSRLAMQTTTGPFPMQVDYRFEDDGDGTRVTVRNRGGSGPLFAIAAPLIGLLVRRRVQGDLEALRRALEAGRPG